MVRNPYWRFVSAYNYLRAGGQADMPIADNLAWARVLATVSVDELLALLTAREDSGDRRLDALMAEHGAADLVMFLPQSRLLCADSGAGAVLVDSVLRMEEMAASGKISVPGVGEVVVEHVNPTREKAVTVLSESTAAGIFRLYRRDFAVFGYDQGELARLHVGSRAVAARRSRDNSTGVELKSGGKHGHQCSLVRCNRPFKVAVHAMVDHNL